jgi:hypothetical protein
MKFYTMRFVRFANQISHFVPQNSPERHRICSHDRDGQLALAQRPRHFQSDEARANDNRAFCILRLFDDTPAVSQRSQITNARQIGTGDRKVTG